MKLNWEKKQHESNKLYIAKQANLSKIIFGYMHVTRCKQLFSLACYHNLTYV